MDDEFLSKIMFIAPWMIAIVVVFVLGMPIFHAVSTLDAALFQVGEAAKTGASINMLDNVAETHIEAALPTQMNTTVLFNPVADISVMPNQTDTEETIELSYNEPIFAPFVSLFGLTGPTIPIHDARTVVLATTNDQGVNYAQ